MQAAVRRATACARPNDLWLARKQGEQRRRGKRACLHIEFPGALGERSIAHGRVALADQRTRWLHAQTLRRSVQSERWQGTCGTCLRRLSACRETATNFNPMQASIRF